MFNNIKFPLANPSENMEQDKENKKEMLRSVLEISHEQVKRVIAMDLCDRSSGVEPDKTGCYRCFVRTFITFEMSSCFTVIAHRFFENTKIELSSLAEPWFFLDEAQMSTPSDALNIRLFNMIFNAAVQGDEYAKNLIVYLYKRFYKKEYNQIKRFRVIDADEIYSIVDEKEGDFTAALGRVLTMIEFLEIKLKPEYKYLYYLIDGFNEKDEERKNESKERYLELNPSLFKSCSEIIDSWNMEYGHQNEEKLTRVFFETDEFVENCFRYHGYPYDYAFLTNDEFHSFDMLYTRTLALLKTTWKKGKFTFEDVQKYSEYLFLVETIISISDTFDLSTSELLGVNRDYLSEGQVQEIQAFDSKIQITYNSNHNRKSNDDKPEKKETAVEDTASKNAYISEIASLRNKLHEQEQKYNQIREEYHDAKRIIAEQKGLISKYEADREELIALRKFVSSTDENDTTHEIPIQEMKDEISKKRIIIIGGHTSWINKLQAQFPEWMYISLDNYRTAEFNILDKADHVYFFTDYISHTVYGRFVKAARDKGISFGYLHKLNIDEVTKYIYFDVGIGTR